MPRLNNRKGQIVPEPILYRAPTPEALTHTPGTVIAPGKAVKGGGGAGVITVWAGEGVEKEGSWRRGQ